MASNHRGVRYQPQTGYVQRMTDREKADLVAVHDRREVVIQTLSTHFAGDVLDMDEVERRVDLAHRVETVAELDELVSDLDSPRSERTPSTTWLSPWM